MKRWRRSSSAALHTRHLHSVVLLALAYFYYSSAAGAAPTLTLLSPDDVSAIPLGNSITVNVLLSNLAPSDELDGLLADVTWDSQLLGAPAAVMPGEILPRQLHDPSDFDAGFGPGIVEGSFLTLGTLTTEHIAQNGLFFDFVIPSQALGSGVISFEFALGTKFNISDPVSPIDARITTGDALPFTIVPEPTIPAIGAFFAFVLTSRRLR